MAFAFVADSVKTYPLTPEAPLRNIFLQVVEFEVTAAASDTALTLATLAAASDEGDPIVSVLAKAEKVLDYEILESPRLVTASGAGHTYNGSKTGPVWTFTGTASTPTAMTFYMLIKLKPDENPVYSID